MPKYKSTRLSSLRTAFVSEQFNKHPKKIIGEALIEFEEKKELTLTAQKILTGENRIRPVIHPNSYRF